MNSSFRTLNLKLLKIKKRFIEWGKIEYVPVAERMANEWRYWEALWRSGTKVLKETAVSDVVLKLETQGRYATFFFLLSLTKTVRFGEIYIQTQVLNATDLLYIPSAPNNCFLFLVFFFFVWMGFEFFIQKQKKVY